MFCNTSDNLRVYYEVTGNREASETVVFLNGLTQSTLSWGLVLPFFKDDYKVVLLDLIFQGQSDRSGPWRDFDQHAADVECVLKQEKISAAHMVGLSFGSLVAQNFAVLFPARIRKLVLVSTFAHKTAYYEAVELAWWRALETGGYNLMLDIMLPSVLSETYFSNPLIPIQQMKEARKDQHQDTQSLFNLMRATRERKDYRTNLNRIHLPTMVIQGERDQLLPVHLATEVHLNIQNSKLVVIKNAGHTLNLEHVSEVCGYIRGFLEKIE